MQKHFANRSHNFGVKLAEVKNTLLQRHGAEKENEINRVITQLIRSNKVRVEDTQAFIECANDKLMQLRQSK